MGFYVNMMNEMETMVELQTPEKQQVEHRFLLYHKDSIRSVSESQVYLIKASEGRLKITTKDGETYYCNKTLSDVENKLNAKQFFRVHRSLIISFDSIARIQLTEEGRIVVTFKEQLMSPETVSRSRTRLFKLWLGD